ncbi:hypothetical protein ACTXJ9_11160 [Brachybacterium tyrofermentans]|uniref:hypothetical protein n=1 Tax=Brachybacterium tyrofermentans TaxID=47848 RepID=UPI003FCFF131
MAMERVPYLVGGGFEHSAEVMRAMLAAATSGAEGLVNAGDMKVAPLPVPGTSVTIAPGNALIRNSYGGGSAQTYACRAASQTEMPIEATGSSGWRNDLIVARVDDPTYQGGAFDPVTFEAARFEVIRGVASDQATIAGLGLTYPAIPLARLNIPPSTGTITATMITDLRKVALPRVERHLFTHGLSNEETDDISSTPGDGMGEQWPNVTWYFDIPDWATRVRVRAILGGVRVENIAPNNFGQLFVRFGSVADGFSTQMGRWDSSMAGGITRQTFMVADDRVVPASFRGTDSRAYIRATRTNNNANTPRLDTFSSISLDVEFYETAV